MLPERERIAEEHRALVVEALERVEAAVLARSQSVQSLSPGVNMAGALSELR